jgi:hypothetical protein
MLRWEREDGRFYEVTITRDLFDTWNVIKLFGGEKKGKSQLVHIPCENKQAALDLVAHIAKRRKAHKYKLVNDDLHV